MKRGKRPYRERAQARLLDLWTPGADFGDPVGCVATTFTFDAGFFEEECLARFARIESDPAEDVRQYVLEREEKLSQAFACVLVDQAHVPTKRSLRWHVLAARVPGGILHSKLSLLVWQRAVRIVIASANLTEPGYRRNFENACVLEFTPEDGLPLELVEEVLRFVESIRAFAPGDSDVGPQAGLRSFLRGVKSQISSWTRTKWRAGAEWAVLVPIVPGGPSLFKQLASLTNERYRRAWVQTPFFDDGDGCLGVAAKLAGVMAKRGERELVFVVPGCKRTDGVFEIEAPECLKEPFRGTTHSFQFVSQEVPGEEGGNDKKAKKASKETRPLHAKAIWLQNHQAVLYCLGSSNFTHAGTGIAKRGRGNVELNLAYVFPDIGSELAQISKETFPPYLDLDLDEHDVKFLPGRHQRTTDGSDAPSLPAVFGAALFHPGPSPRLALEILADPSFAFDVTSDRGDLLLTLSGWKKAGSPCPAMVPWPYALPPSHLEVRWGDNKRSPQRSIWTVNVIDTSLLPPPAEQGQLTLEELLEVLSSTQRPYQVAAKILRRREEVAKHGGASHLDPHRRIESHTRTFLLQRMRRLSAALEGLRERLEQPVHRLETLQWRLRGPYGPLVLARQVASEAEEGAAFMIAEVAETVGHATIPAAGELTVKAVASTQAKVVRELEAMARQHPAPAALSAYVRGVFKELGR